MLAWALDVLLSPLCLFFSPLGLHTAVLLLSQGWQVLDLLSIDSTLLSSVLLSPELTQLLLLLLLLLFLHLGFDLIELLFLALPDFLGSFFLGSSLSEDLLLPLLIKHELLFLSHLLNLRLLSLLCLLDDFWRQCSIPVEVGVSTTGRRSSWLFLAGF